MCRLLVFKGTEPILLSHLLTRPAHSIINQAFDSRLRVDLNRPINGDGFGVGWYDSEWDPELGDAPCIFTSVTPAWNNTNLHRLAEKIKSPLVFGHVRASTAGALSETNCHPWRYGRLMWMHNGQISGFSKIKRRLLAALPEPLFLFPQGHTDSEFAFALYLSHLKDPSSMKEFSCKDLKDAMLNTIRDINIWSKEAGIEEPSLMNFCVTDGQSIACTRYVSSKTDEAASLYFSTGTSFYEHSEGAYRMVKADRRQKIVVIASEPLTFEKGMHRCMNSLAADWMEVESNTILCITPNMNVLQYPILDEYHSPRSQMHVRNPNFAMRAGFHPNTHIAPEIREHIQTDSVCGSAVCSDVGTSEILPEG
ncbi:glutamine amidotransferase subunit [Malassezia vespertilionis]|uniref:glutamine amidotransferase subunit n=1 Tax=Malassezia vespertilionis TaxID=2020962 RepID=UPI0024B209C8|nr:glutamine amidotransferase subunit [Malassezia vespertilionis]WFD08295.1 glutamine amidotransferase subunit [Malassezia vespertilionis]